MLSALDYYIEQHVETGMQELARLCAQPSVSAQNLGIRECAGLVAEMLRSRGIAVKILETAGHPVVYGEYGSGARTILLYNHYDVQPPEPLELWHSSPFASELRDGCLFARGAVDDKGNIVSRLAAFDAYRAVYGEPPFRVKFLFEGEEEIGSPSLEDFISTHRDLLAADACVWEAGWLDLEGRLMMYLGMRGIVAAELRLRSLPADVHSGMHSYLPNAAWRLVWALSTLKDQHERVLIPGFYDGVKPLTARQGELLDALPFLEEELKAYYGISAFAGNLSGRALREAVFQPTCTINGIGGGYQGAGSKTIIPAEASCKLDFRLVPDQDPADIVEKLRAHLDAQGFADVEIEAELGVRAATVDPDDPFVRLAVEAAREVYGNEPVVSPITGGSGPYAYFVEHLHVPIVASGVGYPGSLSHAPNEHMRVRDWVLGTRHMARIFAGL